MIQCYMVVIVTTFFGVCALVTHKELQMKDNLKCLTIVHFNQILRIFFVQVKGV
jgi:hypothetical protein